MKTLPLLVAVLLAFGSLVVGGDAPPTEFDQKVNQSIARATASYPDADKPGTPLHGAIAAEVARLVETKSPLLQEPDWPETLAAKHANRLGLAARPASAQGDSAPVAAAMPSLDIQQYMPPAPFSVAMETPGQKSAREESGKQGAMQKIEQFGLYAVANQTLPDERRLSDGNSWTVERGETYRFLGFDRERGTARVRIGRAWIAIPVGAVAVVSVKDAPTAEADYQKLVAAMEASAQAGAQQRALDETNRRLQSIQQQQAAQAAAILREVQRRALGSP